MTYLHEHHYSRHGDSHKHEFGPRGHGRRHPGHHWAGAREGRGRRQRFFDSGELRLVLLKLIADESRHGYDLIRAIEELTAGNYSPSPGVVYPALSILQDIGHIEATESVSARKVFAITSAGNSELAANAELILALFARLAALAATYEHTESGPVRRALENLRTVLRHRLGDTAVEKNILHDIAAIIDDAAQRIERL